MWSLNNNYPIRYKWFLFFFYYVAQIFTEKKILSNQLSNQVIFNKKYLLIWITRRAFVMPVKAPGLEICF